MWRNIVTVHFPIFPHRCLWQWLDYANTAADFAGEDCPDPGLWFCQSLQVSPPCFVECVPLQFQVKSIYLFNLFTLAQVPPVKVVTDREEKTVCCSRKDEFVTVYPADVVLFEGILMFYSQEIRDLFQMKLFVDTDPDTRLSRRGV